MKRKDNTLISSVRMILDIWRLKHGKRYILIKLLCALLSVVNPIILSITPGLILNELLYNTLSTKLIYLIIMATLVPTFISIISSLFSRIGFKLYKRLMRIVTMDFYSHLANMDYETLERPDVQDLKARAVDAMPSRFVVVDSLCSFISTTLGIITISYILSRLSPIIVIVQIIIVFLNSRISIRTEKKSHDIIYGVQKLLRRQWGFTNTLDKLEYAKDIRMYNADRMILDKINYYQEDIDNESLRNTRVTGKSSILQSLTNVAGQLIIYAFIVYSVLNNNMPIGNITIFITSASQFNSFLNSIMKIYVAQKKNLLQMNDYNTFISTTSRFASSHLETVNLTEKSIIKFESVSFKYPGSDRYAISDLNISFCTGEHLCIVGNNGAGKTTFVKLLTRLYEPTMGRITLDGKDIRGFDRDEYQRLFSCVFQDATRFYLTIKENITLTDNINYSLFERACSESGISELANKLKLKFDTQVGKWIDPEGVELSGGEAQTLSIARALYHNSDVYILDEPTASLDPNAENRIYRHFNSIIKGKTAILITHRLSAVQLADKIAVFNNGCVEEFGTHDELYAAGGLYKTMFDKQASYYIKAANNAESLS